MLRILLIGLFGAVGAISRYLVGLTCVRLFGPHFAFGTLLVNVVGCFLLGLFMQLFEAESFRIPDHIHSAMTVGFLGALTTFSTFGYDTIRHLEDGQWQLAGLNVLGNLILGLLAAGAGLAVGKVMG